MLELNKIQKSYKTGDFTQQALKEIDLKFRKNEFVAVLGPSGSGKTTLLNIIGGLDRYDKGDLIINGKSTKNFKDSDWDAYRNNCIGFIFQSYNLIGHMDILSNVEMGMTLSGVSSRERKRKAFEVLEKVGLKEHIHKRPNQLSGGQMQRVAIARALANDPDIILADEPTGALDSKTSIQIMNLIKEIAKDKLVIMVTHNPELARDYANRVIEMRDGEIIGDTNPLIEEKASDETYKIRKTSMSFFTALHLSLNNIRTKKGRTLLTAFASSIGIIGIALILSLSNGFDLQISKFEKSTLSAMPIIISEQSMNMDEDAMAQLEEDMENTDNDYPDISYIIPSEPDIDKYIRKNNLTEQYMNYLEKMDSKYVSGISYTYMTGLNLIQKNSEGIKLYNSQTLGLTNLPHTLSDEASSVIEERYDILAGREAKNANELFLIVDSKNRVSLDILEALGINTTNNIPYNDILGKGIDIVWNDDFYLEVGNYYIPNTNLEELYLNENNYSLTIVGIGRLKKDYPSMISSSGLCYTNELMEYVIDKNSQSKIVSVQENASYNVMTGEMFDLTTEEGKEARNNLLKYLGSSKVPYVVQIYPKDFDSKEYITDYLEKYNDGLIEEEKIVYIDQADLMSSLSGDIMDAITVVLVAFSSISLVVSSIMIGIIMYISVLERTKEIGILRSLGARKKDISRVFNAETFIIGVTSGLIGILIARLLLIPTNSLLLDLTNLENVAVMNPVHAIILITVSVILTLIGGYIPAKLASKKDPVIALRTE